MLNETFIIDIDDALRRRDNGALFVDVRSPDEFTDGTIPGAVNVPILTNEQRAEIGTLFKQKGPDAARHRGMHLVAPHIPHMIEEILSHRQSHRQPIVIFCWRGGLRSRAMTAFLQLAGYPAFQLRGGHKAFRRTVLDFFEQGCWARMLVLRGLTGVGKTRILQQVEQRDWPVIDLEGLANHRGSAFGGVGLGNQPSQKTFEALLWDKLRKLDSGGWALTEGESRHIGRLLLPLRFYQSLQTETTLWLETSMDNRVRIILEDYQVDQLPREAFIPPIESIKCRLGGKETEHMLELLHHKQWQQLISELMVKYYDPLYRHTRPDDRVELAIDPFAEQQPELKQAIDRILATPNNG
ncbi:tRNA 2-selenouridine(34) synthase MnmH [uncultured Desulfuromonas sp.]|uniref:tRNA 2-selenouridine(34) synthase MnmH n=1 Tax=uncultured Desulfuromonas sp. TaxID=181013 RepID=UPI002AAC0F4A|nr:tRNA 2-selenouridine(34) synthase MnmH [uncultured Desulfuromonas sp.]